MKRRIIHVIESLGIGGGQAVLFELYFAIEKYYPEYPQTVILTHGKRIDKNYVNAYGVPFETTGSNKQFTKKVLEYKEPVIVIFHKLMCSNLEFLRGVYRKVPVIVVSHTYSSNYMHNRIRHCNGVVSVCKHMRDELYNRFHVRGNHVIIHNGVNAWKYAKLEPIERDESDQGKLITGRVNCLNAIKYSDDWVEFCARTELAVPMVHEYVGGGLIKRARKVVANVDDPVNEVRILGPIQHFETKMRTVKSWDLFLYEINRPEGVSVALLEALASGVPVVCSDHHGNKEVIDEGVNGYVFRNHDEAHDILKMLSKSPERLQKLKETTTEHFIENLDGKIMAAKYIDFIEKTIIHRATNRRGVVTLGGKQDTKPSGTRKTRKVLTAKPRRRIRSTIGRVQVAKDRKKRKTIKQQKDKNVKNKNKKKKKEEVRQIVAPEIVKNKSGDQFTILTGGYNSAPYAEEWADSILVQDYRPLQVVFVDDSSSDKTYDIMQSLTPKFRQADIEFIPLKNKQRRGCGTTYSSAFARSTSDFMGVLDADDMLVKGCISYIMDIYATFPDIAWIYSQFDMYSHKKKKVIKRGFCKAPRKGYSLLDMGLRRNTHTYSHWRTFTRRIDKIHKIFKKGLRSGVDKYMGYRLEEMGPGMFIDRVLYRYRQDVPGCISKTEPARKTWMKIMKEAEKRRRLYKLKPYPIVTLKE